MYEKHYRSIVKTISWRVLGTIDTMVISFVVTGNVLMAVSIGSIEVVTKMILYYLHERGWDRSNFGRYAPSEHDYQI
ncbi:MAG: DUF2061 domain-containing protein [Sulfuricurvum sp.]